MMMTPMSVDRPAWAPRTDYTIADLLDADKAAKDPALQRLRATTSVSFFTISAG